MQRLPICILKSPLVGKPRVLYQCINANSRNLIKGILGFSNVSGTENSSLKPAQEYLKRNGSTEVNPGPFVKFKSIPESLGYTFAVHLKNSHFQTTNTNLVAFSTNTVIDTSTISGFEQGVLRLIAGDSCYYKKVSAYGNEAFVYLSTKKHNKFTLLHLDGSNIYFSRPKVVSATGPGILIEGVPSILGLGLSPVNLRIAGSGPLAISTPYPLLKINLKINESIHIDPRSLVFWDASIDVDYADIPIEESNAKQFFLLKPFKLSWKYLNLLYSKTLSPHLLTFSKRYLLLSTLFSGAYSIAQKFACIVYKVLKTLTRKFLSIFRAGVYGYPNKAYRAIGPGTLYIEATNTSRLEIKKKV